MSTVGLFGRQFTEVGSSNSDFLIKTKGKVKIQWGNKFIELIKDGKIAVDGFLFHTVKDKESISGKDGFYITEDGGVYIKYGNNAPISIFGEIGTAYVSFVESLDTSPELKSAALKNIGLVFNTLAEAQDAKLLDGIVYIIDEKKFYTIQNYILLELTSSSQYMKKFIILIGLNDLYSLLIDGYYDLDRSCIVIGKENSGLYLYSTAYEGVVLSRVDKLLLLTGDNNLILIEDSRVTIRPVLVCDSLLNEGASSTKGYRLYMNQGESILEIDNLILRHGITPLSLTYDELLDKVLLELLTVNNYYIINDFLNEWELAESEDYRPLLVLAISKNKLNPKAIMINNPEWEIWYDVLYNEPIKLSDSEDYVTAKGRIIGLRDEFNNKCNYDFKHLRFLIGDDWVYTFGGNTDLSLDGTMHDNDIVVDNYSIQSPIASVRTGIKVSFQGEAYNNNIKSISHDLITAHPFINNTGTGLINCIILPPLSSTYFHGQFNGLTFSALTNPELGMVDKFTDVYMNETELRIICIPDLIIPGMIIMFNGEGDIPTGWAVCDGTNGTPNLIGRFIKADSTVGTIGGSDEIILSTDTLPSGTESANLNLSAINTSGLGVTLKFEPKYYSLIFIMKL